MLERFIFLLLTSVNFLSVCAECLMDGLLVPCWSFAHAIALANIQYHCFFKIVNNCMETIMLTIMLTMHTVGSLMIFSTHVHLAVNLYLKWVVHAGF